MHTSDSILQFASDFDIRIIYSDDSRLLFFHPYRGTKSKVEGEEEPISNRGSLVVKDDQIISINLCGRNLTDGHLIGFWDKFDLSHLKALNLAENQLTQLHLSAKFSSLAYLNISANPSLRTLTFEKGLGELEILDAYECALERISILAGFDKLYKIDLHKNQLSQCVFEADCPALEHLFLNENGLEQFELVWGFRELKSLYLNQNQIAELRVHSNMEHLSILDLEQNQLKQLPEEFLTKFSALDTLYLHNNPNLNIPQEVVVESSRANSLESIKAYLESLAKEEVLVSFHQAKMILVGNPKVGKSSIRIKLLNKEADLPKEDDRTVGLDIATYLIPRLSTKLTGLENEIEFQLKIWDFGGQGRYREIQQLFFSRRSLYLFVTACDDLPENEDYVGFEYWMNMVNAYGYDDNLDKFSPVIHVANKSDRGEKLRFNQRNLSNWFPNIFEFVEISCKRAKDTFDPLEKAIQDALPLIAKDIFARQWSPKWMEVKKDLEKLRKQNTYYISKDIYEEICLKHELDSPQANAWLGILQRAGDLIYFGDDEELKDWIVLEPEWIKNGIIQLLESNKYVIQGIIRSAFFEDVWPEYSEEERHKIILLMLKYKLCFERKDVNEKPEYVIPSLLPLSPSTKFKFLDYLPTPDVLVRFNYEPFLPPGTVSKFIVIMENEMNSNVEAFIQPLKPLANMLKVNIYENLRWRNNVVLHDLYNEAYAHVKEEWEDKCVYIHLKGNNTKPLYEFIHSALEKLNQELKDRKYIKSLLFVPWGWYKNKWRKLADMEDFGIDIFEKNQTLSFTSDPKQLIAQGRLKEALVILGERAKLTNHKEKEVIILQSAFYELQSKRIRGIIDQANLKLEMNQIRDRAIDLSDLIASA